MEGLFLMIGTNAAMFAVCMIGARRAIKDIHDEYSVLISKRDAEIIELTKERNDLMTRASELEAERNMARMNLGPTEFLEMPGKKSYKASSVSYGEF